MATVTNTVKLPDGSTPNRVDVVIELVASTTGKAAGWITATDVTLEATVRPTVTNGAWTASLTPNADITPSGSVYKVTEYVDKTRYTHYIEVGSGGGSLFDLLTDAPATIESSALSAHKSQSTGAHAASAISVTDSGGYYTGTTVEAALAEVGADVAAIPAQTFPLELLSFTMNPTSTIDGMVTDGDATTASGWYGAASGGTMAESVIPLYGNPASLKFSFVVKVTKGTASSESRVGLHINGTVGTVPSSGHYTFTVGYKQGVGLCFVRDNVGPDVVILADSSLTDGQQYRINCVYDKVASGAEGTYTRLTVRAASLADARAAALASTTVNHLTFTPITNLVVKSNVAAGGIRDLQVVSPMLAGLAMPTTATHYSVTVDSDAQQAYWMVPAKPSNPTRLVVLCHGAGGTPANLDSDVPVGIRDFSEGLSRAGFAVIYHGLHGDNWGNASALADIVEIFEMVRDNYDERVRLYMAGISMGALAATLSALNADLPVRAVYTIDGVFDLEQMFGQPSYTAGIAAAHPSGQTSRDAANPMLMSGSLWSGVPFRMVASASDTAVSKTLHADAWAAKSGITSSTLTVTGIHIASSHFLPVDAANFFLTYP